MVSDYVIDWVRERARYSKRCARACVRAMEPCVRNSAHVSPVCVIARACLVTGFESAPHSCAAMRLLGGYTIRVLDQFTMAKTFWTALPVCV